jgi:hypothetical protein
MTRVSPFNNNIINHQLVSFDYLFTAEKAFSARKPVELLARQALKIEDFGYLRRSSPPFPKRKYSLCRTRLYFHPNAAQYITA